MSRLHELWSAVVAEMKPLREDLLNLRELVDLRIEHMMAEPKSTRELFGELRKHDPIFVAPDIAVVSKYDDVLEVLAQDEYFSVTEIYLQKMELTTGAFVLGMADTSQYQREMGLMRQATRPEDLERIRAFVSRRAAELVEGASSEGRIDMVGGLSRLVAVQLLEEYFGASGPDEPTAMRWMRAIFREIFLNLGNDPDMAEAGRVSGEGLREYLGGVTRARRAALAAGETLPDDFLCRLVAMQPPVEDDVICRIVGGTIVGTVDTNSKAIAQAVDQLLDRPQELQAARAAAVEDDDELLSRYVFEALRFNPQNPLLLRRCEQPYEVATGTKRARVIPQGSMVVIGTESAMFDEDRFPDADTFRVDRPPNDYIHFGHGLHTCFGKLIGQAVIPAVSKQLLRREGLRRAAGTDGVMQYDGAFPNRLIVEFDPQ